MIYTKLDSYKIVVTFFVEIFAIQLRSSALLRDLRFAGIGLLHRSILKMASRTVLLLNLRDQVEDNASRTSL
jgi:hypothetical protein